MRRTQTLTINGTKNPALAQKENTKVVGLPVQGKIYGATTDGFGKRVRLWIFSYIYNVCTTIFTSC